MVHIDLRADDLPGEPVKDAKRERKPDGVRFSQPPTFYACRQKRPDFEIATSLSMKDEFRVIAKWTEPSRAKDEPDRTLMVERTGHPNDEYTLRMQVIEVSFERMR